MKHSNLEQKIEHWSGMNNPPDRVKYGAAMAAGNFALGGSYIAFSNYVDFHIWPIEILFVYAPTGIIGAVWSGVFLSGVYSLAKDCYHKHFNKPLTIRTATYLMLVNLIMMIKIF
ncbi:MAG: hypothetical protein AABX04_01780 [Nanoarchaeota archaeon]